MSRCYSIFPSFLNCDQSTETCIEAPSSSQHSIRIGKLLLLLGLRNQDPFLREIVCETLYQQLSEDDWILFCPQLVQALKWDVHEDNALIRFMFLHALQSRSFAYVLYWELQVYNDLSRNL